MKKDLVLEDLKRARQEIERELFLEEQKKNKSNNKSNNKSSNKSNDKFNYKLKKNEINQELRDEKKNKKIIVISILLILLMLSYFYLSGAVFSYIAGIAGSSRIKEGKISFQDSIEIYLNEEIIQVLQELYNPYGDERALCLLGKINNNTYHVEQYFKPIIFDQDWNFVIHSTCPEGTIIMLHTHPFKRCGPSETDIRTLRNTQIMHPERIMLIMCGQKRFGAVI